MKKVIGRILSVTGAIIMVLLILVCLPFTLPKLFGIQLYEVKTESMEPEYPVGSVVYVRSASFDEISVGDVVTYSLGTDTDLVMTHRVIEIDQEKQCFITKGDANAVEDADPVSFSRVIGKPVCCIEKIAVISNFINSAFGIKVIVSIFVLVLAMWLIADQLKKTGHKKNT
ncbi:MAG: signal peptidase I [Agathobacter sp.]|nr:signal peptidase I [Agathobacter sp.]MBQ2283352.1 signal peptidase I [Agathobacter sp.]